MIPDLRSSRGESTHKQKVLGCKNNTAVLIAAGETVPKVPVCMITSSQPLMLLLAVFVYDPLT